MTYVDGFVLLVPKKKLAAYRKMASEAGKIWKKHGALEYVECVGDDLYPNMGGTKFRTFPQLAKPKKGETVVFSFITYRSKAQRDAVNRKVMREMEEFAKEDPERMNKMPFDMARMAYGGFISIVSL